MKIFPLLSLFFLAPTSTVLALPNFEFEIIGTRGYIDVPSIFERNVDGFRRREDIAEIIQVEARGDGNGKQLKKAGKVLDKVGYGLSAASAAVNAVPVVGQVATVGVFRTPWIYLRSSGRIKRRQDSSCYFLQDSCRDR